MTVAHTVLRADIRESGLMDSIDEWVQIWGTTRIKAAERLLTAAANHRVTVMFEGSEIIADMPLDLVERYQTQGLKPSEVLRECFKLGKRVLV